MYPHTKYFDTIVDLFMSANKFSFGTSIFFLFHILGHFVNYYTMLIVTILFFQSCRYRVQTFQLMLWRESIFYYDTHHLVLEFLPS